MNVAILEQQAIEARGIAGLISKWLLWEQDFDSFLEGVSFFYLGPPLYLVKVEIFTFWSFELFRIFVFLVAKMVRQKLIDVLEKVDFAAYRLKDLFEFTEEDAIWLLAYAGALKNEMHCDKCGSPMNIQKRDDRIDGIRVNSFNFLKMNSCF